MDTLPKIAIIIPCYNEADRLDIYHFIEYAKNNLNVCFFFINDGSTDHTGKVIHKLTSMSPDQFFNKNLEPNVGKAEAVRQGFLEAMNRDFDSIGFFDADLATPLSAINNFYQQLEQQNIFIIIGSRVRLLGRSIQRRPIRHYLGRIFAIAASLVLDIPVYDTQCGAKLFKNDSTLRKVFSIPFKTRWLFDVEILGRYKLITTDYIGDHIIEYPLESWKDVKGSKIKLIDFIKAPIELLKISLLINLPSIINGYAREFHA